MENNVYIDKGQTDTIQSNVLMLSILYEFKQALCDWRSWGVLSMWVL